MNKEYIFTLKYKLPACEVNSDELVDRLYTGGCDDALIGIGVPGRIALEFAREAKNAETAIQSAQQDVLKTIPEAELIEAMPDYVGITDIANIVNVSRQQVRKLYQNNLESFPAPVHEGKSSIWHLADALEWLSNNTNYELESSIYEVAQQTAVLNKVKPSRAAYIKTVVVKKFYKTVSTAETLCFFDYVFSDQENYSQLTEAV